MIGLLVPDITDPFFRRWFGRSSRRPRRGTPPCCWSTRKRARGRAATGQTPAGTGGRALVIASPRSSSPLRDAAQGLPAVVIDRRIRGVPAVICDNTYALRGAGRHLEDLGHPPGGVAARPIRVLVGPAARGRLPLLGEKLRTALRRPRPVSGVVRRRARRRHRVAAHQMHGRLRVRRPHGVRALAGLVQGGVPCRRTSASSGVTTCCWPDRTAADHGRRRRWNGSARPRWTCCTGIAVAAGRGDQARRRTRAARLDRPGAGPAAVGVIAGGGRLIDQSARNTRVVVQPIARRKRRTGSPAEFEHSRGHVHCHIAPDRQTTGASAAGSVARTIRRRSRPEARPGSCWPRRRRKRRCWRTWSPTNPLTGPACTRFTWTSTSGCRTAIPAVRAAGCTDRLPRTALGSFHPLRPGADPAAEAHRYAALLRRRPDHLTCLGIGVNGHIAFNEPGDTRFDDPVAVRVVALDEASRRQQVDEGLFDSVPEVPTHAVALTVPGAAAGRDHRGHRARPAQGGRGRHRPDRPGRSAPVRPARCAPDPAVV